MSESVAQAAPTAPPEGEVRGRSGVWLVLIALCVAVTGAIFATVFYDRMVTVPEAGPRAGGTAAPVLAPPVDQDEREPRIDPYAQAIAAVRPELGEDALVDIRTRVDGDVVFLEGEVDSRRTLARVSAAVSRLPGIRALDTRAVAIVNRVHVVEPGENLSRLARRYYGSVGEWRRFLEANPELEDRVLPVGYALIVPPPDR